MHQGRRRFRPVAQYRHRFCIVSVRLELFVPLAAQVAELEESRGIVGALLAREFGSNCQRRLEQRPRQIVIPKSFRHLRGVPAGGME